MTTPVNLIDLQLHERLDPLLQARLFCGNSPAIKNYLRTEHTAFLQAAATAALTNDSNLAMQYLNKANGVAAIYERLTMEQPHGHE